MTTPAAPTAGPASPTGAGRPRPAFDTAILLSEFAEDRALPKLLRERRPDVTVIGLRTLADLEALPAATLAAARLIGFLTPVIVPARILGQLGYGAYNFHPGPPHYPGWAPSHFAVYERATKFGVTAHVMAAQVDAGGIVGVEMFDVPPDTGVYALEMLAFEKVIRLLWRLADALMRQPEPLDTLPFRWSGTKSTRQMCERLCDIPLGISEDELVRRIEIFGPGYLGHRPTIRLHGHRFQYVAPDDGEAAKTQRPPASSAAA